MSRTILKTNRDSDLPKETASELKLLGTADGEFQLVDVGFAKTIAPGNDYVSTSVDEGFQIILSGFSTNEVIGSSNKGISSCSEIYFGTQDASHKSHTVGDYRLRVAPPYGWQMQKCVAGGNWGEGTWEPDCACQGNAPELEIPTSVAPPPPVPIGTIQDLVQWHEGPPPDCDKIVLLLISQMQAWYVWYERVVIQGNWRGAYGYYDDDGNSYPDLQAAKTDLKHELEQAIINLQLITNPPCPNMQPSLPEFIAYLQMLHDSIVI